MGRLFGGQGQFQLFLAAGLVAQPLHATQPLDRLVPGGLGGHHLGLRGIQVGGGRNARRLRMLIRGLGSGLGRLQDRLGTVAADFIIGGINLQQNIARIHPLVVIDV